MPLNIMIIDQSSLVRKHLREMLSDFSDLCVVRDTGSISEVLNYPLLWTVDVAVLDISTCCGAVEDIITSLKQMHRSIQVIVLTDQSDVVYNRFAVSLGADDVIDKANEFTRLPAAVFLCGERSMHDNINEDRTAVISGSR
ncbi:MAG: response regulator transcription factor [Bacteroidota bacterium]